MAYYCQCSTCKQAKGAPKKPVQAVVETIEGARVDMQDGWTLAHYSKADFETMEPTEVHDFGGKYYVGASFFLYTGTVPGYPNALRLMGIGGGKCYKIGSALGNQMKVYYKKKGSTEVAIRLGCGGTISFDKDRNATGFEEKEKPATVPKKK